MGAHCSRPSTIIVPSLYEILTPQQRLIILRSWTAFFREEGDPGVKIFLHIFAKCPAAKGPFLEMYCRRETVPTEVSELERTELMRFIRISERVRHFIKGLDQMINGLGDDETQISNDIIAKLGARHCFIEGFNVDYLEGFADAILDTMRVELPRKVFTVETEEAWGILLDHTVEQMRLGYKVAKERLETGNIRLGQPNTPK